jgi:ABC-2 type transport system ATP-binding protein
MHGRPTGTAGSESASSERPVGPGTPISTIPAISQQVAALSHGIPAPVAHSSILASPARPSPPRRHATNAITAEGLVKVYKTRKNEVRALDGLDLEVEEGTVLGLLGPNGAGKTTAVRVLSTLLRPDAGRATVAGFDVVRQADQLRRAIGLSGQYAAVDENLTGRENLWMFGRLYQLSSGEARARATELLEQFELSDAADRTVTTYSGGMRRRLDLGSALIGRPHLLFLDEPTTGLDPRSRLGMWDVIRSLVREGTTLLLTTQYLEEADELANTIAVVDHGRIIARGTADELKSQVGGERIEVVVHGRDAVPRAIELLTRIGGEAPIVDEHTRRLTIPAQGGAARLVQVVRDLDEAGIGIDDIALRRPTLDDVFLRLTGHASLVEDAETAA